MQPQDSGKRRRARGWYVSAVLVAIGMGATAYAIIETTLADYFQPGTQPLTLIDDLETSDQCILCHGFQDPAEIEVAANWQGSMMAQAARDPLFYACLAIANQDANFSGELCIRCHSPGAWLAGRSVPTDASGFIDADRDGVNCSFCHRRVDPVFKPGVSPAEDEAILALIDPLPIRPGSGNYIVDPEDRIRGPFDIPGAAEVMERPVLISPFHQTSELCADCHDVGNPVYERQPDGTYALGALDEPHATNDQYDMMPIERTYSEWLNSDYPNGVDAQGRFGGNLPDGIVRTCQDCHMPDRDGKGCVQDEIQFPARPDMPRHDFAGGNTWIRRTIPELFPQDLLGNGGTIRPEYLDAGEQRSINMLQLAATLDIEQLGSRLSVRVTNESGHKLPTGYPEGRRMWLNVEFFDEFDDLIAVRGAYDLLTADLTTHDTKVLEIVLGIDSAVAELTGIPEGPTFHLVLNNKIYKDNRIPPRGFTNAAYEDVGAAPVGTAYADGQYWNDTPYALPDGAATATVNLYYQTSSKEYIEFLRDENVTDDWGQTLYDLWEAHGKSEPVLMASGTIELFSFLPGDDDGDGDVDLFDYEAYLLCHTGPNGGPYDEGCEIFDFDVDGDVDFTDYDMFQRVFTGFRF